jgi:hypothetical protein
MWIELVSELFPDAQFGAPVGEERLDAAGGQLRRPVPRELRQLLLEADGVRGQFLVGVVWDLERIARDNSEFRSRPDFASLYESFDDLIFFGDNGGGDQFALRADGSEADVFVWEHETDERRKVAENLRDYLEKCLTSDGDDWYSDS